MTLQDVTDEIRRLCRDTNLCRVEKVGPTTFCYFHGLPNDGVALDKIVPETFVGLRVHRVVELLESVHYPLPFEVKQL